jgi:large subunit ribosomal protein L10
MNREEKAAVVDEIAGQIAAADAVIAVDYRGVNVSQIAEVRAKLRESDTKLRVVKNSLSERAADQAGAQALKPLLIGPTALALVGGDVAVAAKALSDVQRVLRGPLEFKGGLLNGAVLSADEIRTIARLPARGVLHAQLVGTIAAPLTGLARSLNALISGVAIQLQAIADQGLVSGSEPATEATEPEPATEATASEATASEATASEATASEATASEGTEPEPATEATEAAATEAEPTEPEPAPQEREQSQAESEQPETETASDDAPSDE